MGDLLVKVELCVFPFIFRLTLKWYNGSYTCKIVVWKQTKSCIIIFSLYGVLLLLHWKHLGIRGNARASECLNREDVNSGFGLKEAQYNNFMWLFLSLCLHPSTLRRFFPLLGSMLPAPCFSLLPLTPSIPSDGSYVVFALFWARRLLPARGDLARACSGWLLLLIRKVCVTLLLRNECCKLMSTNE